jgi:hypothetical protein
MVTNFFSIGKISQKEKKIENEMILEISNCQKLTKKIEILRFLDLQCVTKNMKRQLKFFRDDHHFGCKQKFLKTH